MTVILTLEIIASSHLLLFGLFTLFNSRSRNLGITFLGGFFCLLGIHFMLLIFIQDHMNIQLSGSWPYSDIRTYVLSAFLLAYGPLLLIAGKLYLQDAKTISKDLYLHFIAIPIYAILTLQVGGFMITWPNNHLSLDRMIIFTHLLSYILISTRHATKNHGNPDTKIKLKLLLLIYGTFGLSVMIWIIFILNTSIVPSKSLTYSYFFLLSIIAMIDGTIIYIFKYPDLYITNKYLRSRIKEWSSEKYNYSTLNDDYAKMILSSIEEHVVNKRLYKNSRLNLSLVSEEIGFPSKDISQVINSRLKQSFREYINDIRIQKAGEMLVNRKNMRVNEVMYNVGFSTRSNFHKYFKHRFGTTPKQYK